MRRGLLAASGGGFEAQGVHFDGTNDYLTRGAGLTGAADSKLFTFSVWAKASDDGNTSRLFGAFESIGGSNRRFNVGRMSLGDNIQVVVENILGNEVLDINTAGSALDIVAGWVNILISVDMSDTGKRHFYTNDVSNIDDVNTYIDNAMDFTNQDWAVAADGNGANKFFGDMSELWFEDGVYTDFSVEANRRKFISAAGKPVFLGDDGSLPTGTSPLVYLSGPTATWHTNKGTGGGFTENGAITDATTSPSD